MQKRAKSLKGLFVNTMLKWVWADNMSQKNTCKRFWASYRIHNWAKTNMMSHQNVMCSLQMELFINLFTESLLLNLFFSLDWRLKTKSLPMFFVVVTIWEEKKQAEPFSFQNTTITINIGWHLVFWSLADPMQRKNI